MKESQQYPTTVQVDDIRIYTESCWIIGGRRERESNKGGETNQVTEY
jgi:hypothetical protein